jgi:ferric-dicitrate binding protein FerR (iron transport regulator)
MIEPINQTRCPICLEMIPENAFICGKCQSVLVPQEWKTWCAEFRSLDPHARFIQWIEMTDAQRKEAARAWEALKQGEFPEFSARAKPPYDPEAASRKVRLVALVIVLFVLGLIVTLALER